MASDKEQHSRDYRTGLSTANYAGNQHKDFSSLVSLLMPFGSVQILIVSASQDITASIHGGFCCEMRTHAQVKCD